MTETVMRRRLVVAPPAERPSARRFPAVLRRRAARFPIELWAICLIVGLGAVEAVRIGFYQFRISDLVLDLGALYCVAAYFNGRLSRRVRVLLFFYVTAFAGRVLLEALTADMSALRTLFGMAAITATPLVFFAVRDAAVTRPMLRALLAVACAVSLLSQAGLLRAGESYVSGIVTLPGLLGISSPAAVQLDYTETTITVWRAFSVGLTLAALVARASVVVKALGALGFVLQFTGGGGGRSQLLFLAVAPLLLFIRPGARSVHQNLRRVPLALAAATLCGAVYLWAPVGGSGPVKGSYAMTHFERATEIVVLFTQGWSAATDLSGGGLNARIPGWETYWNGITSDPKIFWLGTGLSLGAAFPETANILAHNMILDVWAISGLVGLSFFVSFLWFVVRDLWALLKAVPRGGADELLGLSVAGAVMYMFQWLAFQAATADRSFMIVFFLLSGLLAPTTRLLRREAR